MKKETKKGTMRKEVKKKKNVKTQKDSKRNDKG